MFEQDGHSTFTHSWHILENAKYHIIRVKLQNHALPSNGGPARIDMTAYNADLDFAGICYNNARSAPQQLRATRPTTSGQVTNAGIFSV